MYKMYLGCLFMLGGYYFRKPIVYNGIYTWVIMEEYFNSFKNKYFRNKLNVYEYKDKSIIEVFDKNFMYRKCFLKSKENQEYPENQENHEYNDIVFNTNISGSQTSTFSFNVKLFNSETIELTNAKLPFIFQFAATIARLFIFHS